MTFSEPLSFPAIQQLVQGFLQSIAFVAFPVLVLLVVYIGFRYVVARGDARAIQDTHAWFGKILITTVVIAGLWAIFSLGNNLVRYLIS